MTERASLARDDELQWQPRAGRDELARAAPILARHHSACMHQDRRGGGVGVHSRVGEPERCAQPGAGLANGVHALDLLHDTAEVLGHQI